MKYSSMYVGDVSGGAAVRALKPVEDITVLFPVTCPRCGSAGLMESPVIVVKTALTLWNNMRLYAGCHAVAWNASRGELENIRRYLTTDGWEF